jgi:hypothetical protein
MQGSGFATWGAGMGFNFNDPGNGEGGSNMMTYDASAYSGLMFWARVGSASTASIRLNISDKQTDPAGGICAPMAKCSDDFGVALTLTTDWQAYTVKFSDLAQEGWGQAVATGFDAKNVYAVHFQVTKGSTFDVWVDDLYFLTQ